jgi:cellobiose transport system substrate-binding protein
VAGGAAAGANVGGSFLAVPAAGAHHNLAFRVISWILSPENQAKMFAEAALFPSTPAAYTMTQLTGPDPFFGGQHTGAVFAESAQKTRRAFQSPADWAIGECFGDQLQLVETHGKDPAKAWLDAVSAGRAAAKSHGVLV